MVYGELDIGENDAIAECFFDSASGEEGYGYRHTGVYRGNRGKRRSDRRRRMTAGLERQMWLLLACTTPAPPFTCEDAAAALGHPKATVDSCDQAPHLPEIYQVALTGDEVGGHLIIGLHVVDGKIDPAHGNKAVAGFLDALGDRRKALTMHDMMATLRAFDAFPAGFDAKTAMFDLPSIGTSHLTAEPFEVVIYNGRPPDPGFIRATLTGPPWVWALAELPDGATEWKETGKVELAKGP